MDYDTITLRVPKATPVIEILSKLVDAGFTLRMGEAGLVGQYDPARRRISATYGAVLNGPSARDLQDATCARVAVVAGGYAVVLHRPRHWRAERYVYLFSGLLAVWPTEADARAYLQRVAPELEVSGPWVPGQVAHG
jgi:hypothetical protein